MPRNLRQGIRRFGIVVSVLGGAAGAIRGYFIAADTYALSGGRFRQESALTNYAIASLLPVLGFWLPWEITRLDFVGAVKAAHHPWKPPPAACSA